MIIDSLNIVDPEDIRFALQLAMDEDYLYDTCSFSASLYAALMFSNVKSFRQAFKCAQMEDEGVDSYLDGDM